MNQAELDRANAAFWNEICGTSLASGLRNPTIRNFDYHYLRLYPWLPKMIKDLAGRGERVLEIGPGYGTVGRLLVRNRVNYTALDIAPKVIEHIQATTSPNAVLGNVLELDKQFEAGSFDAVCAIGCLHHTGNLPLALEQVHRVLRPAGKLLAMVYGDGETCDFNAAGDAAPHTEFVSPERIPEVFSLFSAIQVEPKRPHQHTDIYIRALR